MRKPMRKTIIIALTSATALFAVAGLAQAGGAADMVVAKMAEGDVSAICNGGRETIAAASKKAVTELAQSGKISGDYKAIGAEAGKKFYQSKC